MKMRIVPAAIGLIHPPSLIPLPPLAFEIPFLGPPPPSPIISL